MSTPAPLDPKNDPSLTEGRFTGLHPDNSYPLVDGNLDEEQEKRRQARLEGARTKRVSSDAPHADHPPFTERFTTNDHAARAAEAAPDVVA